MREILGVFEVFLGIKKKTKEKKDREKSRDFSGSGKNRCRNRRESHDFGALRFQLQARRCFIRQGLTNPNSCLGLFALVHCTFNGQSLLPSEKLHTVRAEIITELILKRVGPVIFKTFLLELIAFRPIPVICPARGVKPENYWTR